MSRGASYLLVIGEREALAWVLREQRMAFPSTHRSEVDRLTVGDELFLLTARGCFHNPGRDRTRIIGRAHATSDVVALQPPVELAGRTFPRGCDLQVDSLSAYRTGVELGPMVPDLECFPRKQAWSMWLRRPLVALGAADARSIRQALKKVTSQPTLYLRDYLESIRPVTSRND